MKSRKWTNQTHIVTHIPRDSKANVQFVWVRQKKMAESYLYHSQKQARRYTAYTSQKFESLKVAMSCSTKIMDIIIQSLMVRDILFWRQEVFSHHFATDRSQK